jgi:hypothetical protein
MGKIILGKKRSKGNSTQAELALIKISSFLAGHLHSTRHNSKGRLLVGKNHQLEEVFRIRNILDLVHFAFSTLYSMQVPPPSTWILSQA